ncbi:NAD(P)/FAD-dependent oxidoreductase [Actinocrispum sp. NPDC049592]|uniref:NAD(P)/FAD-dependent oxidoreductase n=1 Tax=Actinocrispum sp. NPDC049592 TaxID=3154835 RepID=UPI0034402B91
MTKRDVVVCAGAGVLCSLPELIVQRGLGAGYVVYALVVGVLIGHRRTGVAVGVAGGALIGVLGWLLVQLSLVPLLHGEIPAWSAGAVLRGYPVLVADVLHGGLTGFVLAFVPRVRKGHTTRESVRIVIVGGGFAGVSAAKRLERHALRGAGIDVTLVSDSNFLLFTPMLAEVASGALEPAHISAPVRSAVAHTMFRNGRVSKVDADARLVQVGDDVIPYDHLVLAVGSVPHSFGLPGVAEHAWTLKSLVDATRLRDHVIGRLELADNEPDGATREHLLTFVVAGGGFAGTETIAELFDLVHRIVHFFPGVDPGELRFLLVHPGERILPEMPANLADYALQRLKSRGIECLLGVRVAKATASEVWLDNGESFSTSTFVWTAGNRPNPLAGERAIETDARLKAVGLDNVWAVGDCARIPAPDGTHYPPTAQHALRQGTVVADNIAAVLKGHQPRDFRFRTLGLLVALGHRTAAADVRGRQFSGFAAWLLWRGVYLAKLPGMDKRIRVLFDWVLDLVFPRDIVVTGRDEVSR